MLFGISDLKLEAMSQSIMLLMLIVTWYILAAMASSVSKQLLTEFKHPLTLSMGQFFMGTGLCFARAAIAPAKSQYNSPKCQPLVLSFRGLWTIATQYRGLGLQLGAGVILTSVCHRFALMSMPVSFVHTVKAMQPLYAVIFSRIFLGTRCPPERAATICLVVAGVALSAYSELDYTWTGLAFAQCSVIAIASSSVLQKRYMRSNVLMHQQTHDQEKHALISSTTDKANIATTYNIHKYKENNMDIENITKGREKSYDDDVEDNTRQQRSNTLPSDFITLQNTHLPGPTKLASYASTPELATAVNVANDPHGALASAAIGTSGIHAASLDTNSVFFITNAFALILLIPIWSLFDPTAIVDLYRGGFKLIATLGIASLAVVAQHFASISVLEAASTPITHAVASTFKRIFVIVFAIIWFQQTIAPMNAIGIFISVFGIFLYDRAGRKSASLPLTNANTTDRILQFFHHSWTR